MTTTMPIDNLFSPQSIAKLMKEHAIVYSLDNIAMGLVGIRTKLSVIGGNNIARDFVHVATNYAGILRLAGCIDEANMLQHAADKVRNAYGMKEQDELR